jgi:hypothetical protein
VTRTDAANLAGLFLMVLAVVGGGWAAWALSPYLFVLLLAAATGAAGARLAQIDRDDEEP